LYCYIACDLLSTFSAFVIFLSTAYIVCSNYGLIKLYGKIDTKVYLMFPVLTFMGVSSILTVYSLTASIYENSRRMKMDAQVISKSKWMKRQVRCILPAKITIGDQYYIKNSTKSTFLNTTIKQTLDCILTF